MLKEAENLPGWVYMEMVDKEKNKKKFALNARGGNESNYGRDTKKYSSR